MLMPIDRPVLEQLVKDKEFMYKLINNWLVETSNHSYWFGIGLINGHKNLYFRSRGNTQLSIYYADYTTAPAVYIEKRIIKYKKQK